MLFTRKELQLIRSKAEMNAGVSWGIDSSWVRAYQALAFAADHLDAMIARSSESEIPIAGEKES